MKPIFESRTNHPLRIFTVGHQPRLGVHDWALAREQIRAITSTDHEQSMLLVLASKAGDPGFKLPHATVWQAAVAGDYASYSGDRPAAFLFQTADCPTLIIQDDDTGHIAFGHCGKHALSPCRQLGNDCGNVATSVLARFHDSDPTRLSAYITAGISPECYAHEQDPSQVAHFYETGILSGENPELGTLNLRERVRQEVLAYGVPSMNIEIDWRCTKSTPQELSSHRGGHQHRNSIVVLVG